MLDLELVVGADRSRQGPMDALGGSVVLMDAQVGPRGRPAGINTVGAMLA